MPVLKSYTKVYLNYFNYCIDDTIPCEICQNKAVDIHHIETRSRCKDLLNDINNLMALCRKCHIEYGDKKQHKEFLKTVHTRILHGI